MSQRSRAGFTLIELLAVITIIAILGTALVVQVPKYIDKAKVTACRANMQDLYRNFTLYKDRFKDWPNESGVKFFLKLWKVDPNSHDDTFAKRMTCPGIVQRQLPGLADRKPREWFPEEDWNSIDSTWTAYAGRDLAKYPNLDKNPGTQALVADDNELADVEGDDAQPNHSYTTLVLMADGSVAEYDAEKLVEEGTLQRGKYLIPGPECPVKELQTLSREAIEKKGKK